MKQKSPELEIPEGLFYNEIDGYNIYVKSKNRETGLLHDVTIYQFSEGFDNARIIVADKVVKSDPAAFKLALNFPKSNLPVLTLTAFSKCIYNSCADALA